MERIDQISKILEVSNVASKVTVNIDEDCELYSIDELVEIAYFPESKLWEVGYWLPIPGSYWEPDDVDYIKVHETTNVVDAVKYAITSLLDLKLADIGYAIFPQEEDISFF